MTENLSAQTIHDSSTTLLFRPAAHTSLRFLHRVPLDDEYRGEEEEEHRIGLTNGAAHVVNVAEAILDRLKHQYANNVNQLPNFSSQTPVSRVSFARGRAVRSISMVTTVIVVSLWEKLLPVISESFVPSDVFTCRESISGEQDRRTLSNDDDGRRCSSF